MPLAFSSKTASPTTIPVSNLSEVEEQNAIHSSKGPFLKAVSFRWLMSLYWVIPFAFVFIAIDAFVLGFVFKAVLPTFPESLLLYSLLFGLPHIIAGHFVLLGNRDYRGHFKKSIFMSVTFSALGLLLSQYFLGFAGTVFLYSSIVVAHTVKQQLGIARGILRLSSSIFTVWAWSGVVAGICMYSLIYLETLVSVRQLDLLAEVGFISLVIYTVTSIGMLMRRACSSVMLACIAGNTFFILGPWFFYTVGYPFFVILVPRIIHDLTAFTIYACHDHNRHFRGDTASASEPVVAPLAINKVYRFLGGFPVPYAWVLILAIILAFPLQNIEWLMFNVSGSVTDANKVLLTNIVIIVLFVRAVIELTHFIMESIVWKAGSPCRRWVSFRQ